MANLKSNLLSVNAGILAHINSRVKAATTSGAHNYAFRAIEGSSDGNSLLHAALLGTHWNAADSAEKLTELIGTDLPMGVLGSRDFVLNILGLDETVHPATKKLKTDDVKRIGDHVSDTYILHERAVKAVREKLTTFYRVVADTVDTLAECHSLPVGSAPRDRELLCNNVIKDEQQPDKPARPKTTLQFLAQLFEVTKRDSAVWSACHDSYKHLPTCSTQLRNRAECLWYNLASREEADFFGAPEDQLDDLQLSENRIRPFDMQVLFFLAYYEHQLELPIGEVLAQEVLTAKAATGDADPTFTLEAQVPASLPAAPVVLLKDSSCKYLRYHPADFHLHAAEALILKQLPASQWKVTQAFCTENLLLTASPEVTRHLKQDAPEHFKDASYPDELVDAINQVLHSDKLLLVELLDKNTQHYQARLGFYPTREAGHIYP